MFMRWARLAFLHWRVPVEVLRPFVPSSLELDTFDGSGWVGIVPFRMEATQVRLLPRVPTAADFPEVNLRTYVRAADRSGVWFFSLDAASLLAVRGARTMFNLPYHHASMSLREHTGAIEFASRRKGGEGSAEFEARYSPDGDIYGAEPGSLEHWLTERYCLFGQRRDAKLYYIDVHHVRWPLRRGRVNVSTSTLAKASGLHLPETSPELVHYSEGVDVLAWPPVLI
jgi:uncharacterized protein YqjF (DUF2071 family)